jgi:hypothetical protein
MVSDQGERAVLHEVFSRLGSTAIRHNSHITPAMIESTGIPAAPAAPEPHNRHRRIVEANAEDRKGYLPRACMTAANGGLINPRPTAPPPHHPAFFALCWVSTDSSPPLRQALRRIMNRHLTNRRHDEANQRPASSSISWNLRAAFRACGRVLALEPLTDWFRCQGKYRTSAALSSDQQGHTVCLLDVVSTPQPRCQTGKLGHYIGSGISDLPLASMSVTAVAVSARQ